MAMTMETYTHVADADMRSAVEALSLKSAQAGATGPGQSGSRKGVKPHTCPTCQGSGVVWQPSELQPQTEIARG